MGVRSDLKDFATACNRGYPIPEGIRASAMAMIQTILTSPTSSNREKLAAFNALIKADDFNRKCEQSDSRRSTVLGVAKLLGIAGDLEAATQKLPAINPIVSNGCADTGELRE